MRPLAVADARATERFSELQVTRDLGIGSYVGVPIVLASGQPYGTLCAIDPEARPTSPESVDVLRVLARFVASRIDHDRFEAALRASEERYRRLVESVQDVVYRADLDGRIVDISPSVTRFAGFSREELLGRAVVELYEDPDERRRLLEELARSGQVLDVVVRLRDARGRRVHASVNARLITDASGRAIGVEGSLRDVSARVLAEERLRESEERYRALFENAHDLIQSVAPDGRLLYANPAWRRALGFGAADDLTDVQILDVIHPTMREHCARDFARVLAGEDRGRTEGHVRGPRRARDRGRGQRELPLRGRPAGRDGRDLPRRQHAARRRAGAARERAALPLALRPQPRRDPPDEPGWAGPGGESRRLRHVRRRHATSASSRARSAGHPCLVLSPPLRTWVTRHRRLRRTSRRSEGSAAPLRGRVIARPATQASRRRVEAMVAPAARRR